MPFEIERFKSELNKSGGFALTNTFEVSMPAVVGSVNLGNGVAENLTFRIDAMTIPSRGVDVFDYVTYGPPTKIGGFANYTEVEMNVILSPDLRERGYFMKWQDIISGNHRLGSQTRNPLKAGFDIGYFNEYVSESVTISKFNESNKTPIYKIKLVDAFPSQVGGLPLSWEQVEVLKMPVTFSYRYFIEEINDALR